MLQIVYACALLPRHLFILALVETVNVLRDTLELKKDTETSLLKCEMSRMTSNCRVYVGDLGSGGSKPELEREFERYGILKSVWVARNPPGEHLLD